jgi:hypothetical protein
LYSNTPVNLNGEKIKLKTLGKVKVVVPRSTHVISSSETEKVKRVPVFCNLEV